jgi:hypothetical protein
MYTHHKTEAVRHGAREGNTPPCAGANAAAAATAAAAAGAAMGVKRIARCRHRLHICQGDGDPTLGSRFACTGKYLARAKDVSNYA